MVVSSVHALTRPSYAEEKEDQEEEEDQDDDDDDDDDDDGECFGRHRSREMDH
ncbi:hypothetical protein K431DRAFT_287209 [Polychaeton citri CBS 116435]|uniref:Uncharacterized protein n=1 Tax=Polychaeton citri CBS 116435 TaxID=1314669 RepID=A0A9P4Q6F7_9PEZI|nr:hypothetical protein K431DRAFT_287209 [Polychaeton citri CBS 116435]